MFEDLEDALLLLLMRGNITAGRWGVEDDETKKLPNKKSSV